MNKICPILILCFVFLPHIDAMAGERVSAPSALPGDDPKSSITGSVAASLPTAQVGQNNDIIQNKVAMQNTIEHGCKDSTGSPEKPGEPGEPEKPGEPKEPEKPEGTLLDYLPDEVKKYQDEVSKILRDNGGDSYLGEGIAEIVYNEDGSLKFILLDDGTTVSYLYERNDHGKLTGCSIEIGDLKIVFRIRKDDPVIAGVGSEYTVEIYLNDHGTVPAAPKDGPGVPAASKPPIAVFHGKGDIDFEDIARTPAKFDFKNINEAVTETERSKNAAVTQYEKSLSTYYKEMDKVLAKKGLLLKGRKDMPEQAARRAVDRSVADAYDRIAKGVRSRDLEDIVDADKVLRSKVLLPAGEAYEARIKEARIRMDQVIDDLIASKLTLYINSKKDKMDAIVKLPEIKK